MSSSSSGAGSRAKTLAWFINDPTLKNGGAAKDDKASPPAVSASPHGMAAAKRAGGAGSMLPPSAAAAAMMRKKKSSETSLASSITSSASTGSMCSAASPAAQLHHLQRAKNGSTNNNNVGGTNGGVAEDYCVYDAETDGYYYEQSGVRGWRRRPPPPLSHQLPAQQTQHPQVASPKLNGSPPGSSTDTAALVQAALAHQLLISGALFQQPNVKFYDADSDGYFYEMASVDGWRRRQPGDGNSSSSSSSNSNATSTGAGGGQQQNPTLAAAIAAAVAAQQQQQQQQQQNQQQQMAAAAALQLHLQMIMQQLNASSLNAGQPQPPAQHPIGHQIPHPSYGAALARGQLPPTSIVHRSASGAPWSTMSSSAAVETSSSSSVSSASSSSDAKIVPTARQATQPVVERALSVDTTDADSAVHSLGRRDSEPQQQSQQMQQPNQLSASSRTLVPGSASTDVLDLDVEEGDEDDDELDLLGRDDENEIMGDDDDDDEDMGPFRLTMPAMTTKQSMQTPPATSRLFHWIGSAGSSSSNGGMMMTTTPRATSIPKSAAAASAISAPIATSAPSYADDLFGYNSALEDAIATIWQSPPN